MVFSVTFEHKLSGTTSYRAYETIENWVYSQGGKVKENHRPTLIVATHGRTAKKPIGWKKDAKKTMRFELTQQASDVHVKVNIFPSAAFGTEVATRAEEARFNWNELLTSLWARFGEKPAIQEKSGRPPVNWARSMRNGKIMITIGGAMTVGGIVGTLVFPAGGIFLVSTTGTILLVNGLMSIRSARKNLSETKRAQMS
jgi:hypothetical protein